QIHGNRFVAEVVAPASRGLPITAKSHVMQALLQADNIIQVIAPAKDGGGGRSADGEVLAHRNRGRAHSQARWAVRRFRRVLSETDKEIREAHIVHQPCAHLRRQSQNALVGPFSLPRPRGRVHIPGRCKRKAAFVRVPHEHQLPFAQLEVRPATELIYVCRAGKDATKPGKLRCEDFRAYNAALLEPFKSTEEKSAVFTNWASECQPKLFALEERIGIERVPMQCWIGGEMVVAIEEEAGTMELVTAGASCNIDGPACSGSSTQIKVGGGDLKFLHRFLREAHCGSTISDLHDAASICGRFAGDPLESRRLCCYLVYPGQQDSSGVVPHCRRNHSALQAGFDAGDCDAGTGNPRTSTVRDHSGDGTGGNLRTDYSGYHYRQRQEQQNGLFHARFSDWNRKRWGPQDNHNERLKTRIDSGATPLQFKKGIYRGSSSPTRRTRSAKRGSPRKGSKWGCTLSNSRMFDCSL